MVAGRDHGAVVASGAPPPLRDRGELTALTYNVAGLPAGISASRPDEFAPRIGALLNAYDLVLLQEDFCYHERIAANARHPFRSRPQRTLGTLVADGLSQLSHFRFDALQRVRWATASGLFDGCHDRWARKGFTVARTRLGLGATVDVYNLHADAGHGPGDLEARRASFAQLAAFIAEHSAGQAVIVGGDFNLCWSHEGDRAAFAALLDAAALRDVANHVGRPDSRIDRFLFRSGAAVELHAVSLEEVPAFATADGVPLSDHPALAARFEWRPRSAP